MTNPVKTLKEANEVLEKVQYVNEVLSNVKPTVHYYKILGKSVFDGSTREIIIDALDVNLAQMKFFSMYSRVFNIISCLQLA